jgi:hypothetical protein
MMHAGQHMVETLSVEAAGDDVPKRGQRAGEGGQEKVSESRWSVLGAAWGLL